MATLLRSIRQGRWQSDSQPTWLTTGDVPACTLIDLEAKDNILSVYEITDTCDISRIAIALVATRDNLQNFDYAFFDDTSLTSIGISIVAKLGKTPDPVVNQVHRDLGELTIGKLCDLATSIYKSQTIDRISRPKISERLFEAVRSGELDKNSVNGKLKREIATKLWPGLPFF